jgi:ATP synthase F1 delta subunit
MSRISRRALARFAVEQIAAGEPAAAIAKYLAGVLLETGRAEQVDFLLGDIAWELEHRGLVTTATVTSATPLSAQLQSLIKSQLKKAANTDHVLLDERVDKSLIGGVKIETSARVWDTSVRSQLNQIKESV